jgi:hypothetical protein
MNFHSGPPSGTNVKESLNTFVRGRQSLEKIEEESDYLQDDPSTNWAQR